MNIKYLIVNLTCSKKTSIQRCTNRANHIISGNFKKSEIEKLYETFFSVKYNDAIEFDTDQKSIDEISNKIISKFI